MECSIIGSINNLIYKDQKGQFDLKKYFVSNDTKLIDKHFSDARFSQDLGNFNLHALYSNPFVYQTGKLDDFLTLHNVHSTKGLVKFVNAMLTGIINCLWFIKDNSITLTATYVNAHDAGQRIHEYSCFAHSYSTATGEQSRVGFSDLEIFEFNNIWTSILHPYLILPINIDSLQDESMFNVIDLSKFNRIQRALYFLDDARKSYFLPIKITNYMALFESLFLSKKEKEIQKTLCTRASQFIGGDSASVAANHKDIKNAYNVRSRYMHGNKLTFTHDDLKLISSKIDTLTRIILLKIIKEYWELFTLDTDEIAKKNRFDQYWNLLNTNQFLKAEKFKSAAQFDIQTISFTL